MTELSTRALVQSWQESTQRLANARREILSAEVSLRNASNALGARLIPKTLGVVAGERVGIWVRGQNDCEIFLYAILQQNGEYEISTIL